MKPSKIYSSNTYDLKKNRKNMCQIICQNQNYLAYEQLGTTRSFFLEVGGEIRI